MAYNKKSLKNLKNDCPNSGRKAGSVSIITELKRFLKDNPTEIEKVYKALLEAAGKGNTKAIEILIERLDGKMKDRIELDIPKPIIFTTSKENIEIK